MRKARKSGCPLLSQIVEAGGAERCIVTIDVLHAMLAEKITVIAIWRFSFRDGAIDCSSILAR